MINNSYTMEIDISALDIIKYAPQFIFYPTGSRVITPALVSSDSDYDFYCQYSEEIYQFLFEHGFRTIVKLETNYTDTNMECIMEKDNVDIQLRKNVLDFHDKMKAVMELPEKIRNLLFRFVPKEKQYMIWESL